MGALKDVTRWTGEMVGGFKTVLVGMGVTWRQLWRPPVTMHYPDEKWRMPDGFRGLIKVDMDACIVCDLCMKACPVQCIDIKWKREEGKSGKIATKFTVDYAKCLYCGLCTYPCPTNAIWHSHEYENASYSRDIQCIDWTLPEWRVKNPNAKASKPEKPKAKPAAAAPTATAVAAAPAPAVEGVASGTPGKAAELGATGTVTKVWIIDGCIVCDACEDLTPDVFNVTETTCLIREESQPKWTGLSDSIVESAKACPVNVIKYELA